MVGQLGNAGGLSHPIDPHHENYEGGALGLLLQPGVGGDVLFQVFRQGVLQVFKNPVRVFDGLSFHPFLKVFDYAQRGIHAYVGGYKYLLKLLPHRFIQAG